ncbi:hypothetical protein ABB37_05469 [Leptomonas pyrrhocoris]|uniref:Uncharacterized protein n=1 Tax=Leptomonas pyrrhocoris TaxID=157538 RepID=A0A0N0DV22_LEPPY|nr:hypothetical protein ABB37_05469 [Leptomonas pyrrhocoris]KPA79698.1 hypothetical protein ABB37_05469 [Leptomonas pyrrhocoris]|eukprot:XP_015658137.1 hypothetical protein ABB37_05469 [Leptomonas pyrrhocoris]
MSRYAEVRRVDGLHSSHASRDGSSSVTERKHAHAYQTVEELTEQLETKGAAATAPTRPMRGEERQRGRRPSASSALLRSPPSASSPAWNAADVIALYMRRQRYAIQNGKEEDEEVAVTAVASVVRHLSSSSSRLDDGRSLESYSPKLLLLGDDGVVQELAATLRAEAEEASAELLHSDNRNLHQNKSNSFFQGRQPSSLAATTQPPPEVYTLPDAIEDLAALRAELCRWCDVVLLCYRVVDPASFAHLQNKVMPDVLAACSNEGGDEEEEEEEVDGGVRYSSAMRGSADTTGLSPSAAWPALSPPLVIVGVGAEARLSRPTDLHAPWITNAEVLSFAAEAGVQRVVELYSRSPRHVRILLQHCRTLRDVGYEGLASPAAQGRRAALKEFCLHALLRAPPPLLEVHPGSRTVHVALPPRIPTPAAATRSSAKSGTEEAVRCYYTVSDAADVDPTTAVVTASHLVPSSGVLSFADIYDAYAQLTGRPAQHAAAVQLTACTAVPYLFPSEVVHQRLPTPAAPPSGFVDVVHRCCRLTMPTSSRRGTLRGLRGGAARVWCALGDTTTSLEVPPASPQDDRLGAPVSVCIPFDGAKPWVCATAIEQRTRDKDGAWQAWPSAAPAPSQPRLLRVVVEETDEGQEGTSAAAVSSSTADTTFVVPPVLPAPVVEYNALDRSLRLHVPGYRADQVEIRYTLNGSVPTSATGLLYEGAVLLNKYAGRPTKLSSSTGQEEEVVMVDVRAVAFPKLYFASRVAEAHVDVSQSVHALAPASSAPQLQDDEQLASTPHVQWGSPSRPQRTPKRSSSSILQRQRQQNHSLGSARSPQDGRRSPRRTSASVVSAHPLRGRPHSPQPYSSVGGASLTGSDNYSVASDAPTTRSAQLRQAFHAGLYTPPRHPFSQGEGYTPSPRSAKRSGRR